MNTNSLSLFPDEQVTTNQANGDYDVEIEYFSNSNDPRSLLSNVQHSVQKRRRRRKNTEILPENAVKCELIEPNSQDCYTVYESVEEDPLLIPKPTSLEPRRRRRSSVRPETAEERASRLAKMSAYAAQRIANETSEQRAARLRRMSQYAALRLARETPEQRAVRLQRMSAYAARRIAAETPEQRAARLARMAAYAAKRHATKKAPKKGQPSSSNES